MSDVSCLGSLIFFQQAIKRSYGDIKILFNVIPIDYSVGYSHPTVFIKDRIYFFNASFPIFIAACCHENLIVKVNDHLFGFIDNRPWTPYRHKWEACCAPIDIFRSNVGAELRRCHLYRYVHVLFSCRFHCIWLSSPESFH